MGEMKKRRNQEREDKSDRNSERKAEEGGIN